MVLSTLNVMWLQGNKSCCDLDLLFVDYSHDYFFFIVLVFVIVKARDQWGLMPCEDMLWSGVDHCCEVMLDACVWEYIKRM
jgi:hypothetical protein